MNMGIATPFKAGNALGSIPPRDGSTDVFVHIRVVQRSGMNSAVILRAT